MPHVTIKEPYASGDLAYAVLAVLDAWDGGEWEEHAGGGELAGAIAGLRRIWESDVVETCEHGVPDGDWCEECREERIRAEEADLRETEDG